jgi:hypothetical protein
MTRSICSVMGHATLRRGLVLQGPSQPRPARRMVSPRYGGLHRLVVPLLLSVGMLVPHQARGAFWPQPLAGTGEATRGGPWALRQAAARWASREHLPLPSRDTTAAAAGGVPSLPPSLATVTTDTGDLAPGHRDFGRYTTPTWCLLAVQQDQATRQNPLVTQAALDTLDPVSRSRLEDTLFAGVARTARACAAQFPVAKTGPNELSALYMVAVVARDDALTDAVLRQLLTLAPTDAVRLDLLVWAIEQEITAQPARVAAADSLMAQLDTRGVEAVVARLQARRQLLAVARRAFDRARMQQEAEQIITLGNTLSPPPFAQSDTVLMAYVEAYRTLMALALVDHPDSMPSLARRIQQDFQRPVLGQVNHTCVTDASYGARAMCSGFSSPLAGKVIVGEAPVATIVSLFAPAGAVPAEAAAVKPLPPVEAAYWVPGPPPALGHVTLRVTLRVSQFPCLLSEENALQHDRCQQAAIALLQRWVRRYSRTGFAITANLVLDDSLILLRGSEPFAAAAQALTQFWAQVVRVPVTLAISSAAPSPDVPLVALTDRTGRLRYTTTQLDDPVLEALLEQVMAAGSTAGGVDHVAGAPPSVAAPPRPSSIQDIHP